MSGPLRDAHATLLIVVTYSLILKLAAGVDGSTQTQVRQLKETMCQIKTPSMTLGTAETRHQRRKLATVMLKTDISHGQGLTNQHINLVSLITLALAGDVDKILLPKYKHRSHFSLQASWQESSAEVLWDMHSIRELLKDRGIGIQAEPIDGFEEIVLDCGWYHAGLDIADVAYIMKQNIRWHLAEAERFAEKKILLTIRNFDFGLHSSNSQLFRDVMLAIKFSSKLQDIASRILQEIQKQGSKFNGLHLRMEDDIADAVQYEGGFEAAKEQYEEAFRKLQFQNSSLLYVAIGIFTDKASGKTSTLMNQALDWLHKGIGTEYASKIFSKENALSPAELQELSSEQRAAVDVLVLKHSAAFVGLSLSTMSYFVQQLRTVSEHPQETSVMVGNPINKPLFGKTLTLKDQA